MDFKCTYDMIYYDNSDLYRAIVKEVKVTNEVSIVKSIKGSHFEGKTDEDVQFLIFNNAIVKFLPKGLSKIFPNLKFLLVPNCGLKKVSAEDLDGLEALEHLGFPGNQITAIPSNFLRNMKRLKSFWCNNNPLQYLSPKLLTYQNDNLLKSVSFRNSNCINRSFHDDCLTLNELKVTIASTCKPPKTDVQSFTDNLKVVERFWHLWTSGNFSDFTIESDNKEFKVHKCVLGIQSSVLAKAVQSDMEEGQSGRMRIIDFGSDAVEQFLQFFYSGEISEVNAIEVFALAAKYEVQELKNILERIVAENVDGKNALDVLTLGNLHESEIIVKAAFEEMKKILGDMELSQKMMKEPGNLIDLVEAKKKYETNMEAAKEAYQKVVNEKNLN